MMPNFLLLPGGLVCSHGLCSKAQGSGSPEDKPFSEKPEIKTAMCISLFLVASQ